MNIQPDSEEIRKAVKWIAEERKYNPDGPISKIIETAVFKFDLSPNDAEFITRFVKEEMSGEKSTWTVAPWNPWTVFTNHNGEKP